MKKIIILLSCFISLSSLAIDSDSPSMTERLLALKGKAELSLVDFEIFPGASFAAGFEFEVDSAFTQGLYSRRDTWQVSLKAIPGYNHEISDGVNFNLGGGVYNQTELTFYRFFDKYRDAFFTTPYTFKNLPLTARNTLSNNFNVGDYFQLRSTFGAIISLDMLKVLNPNFSVALGKQFFSEAGFQTQIIKLDENRVRLKVITRLGNGTGTSLEIGYTGIINIFNVDFIDNALEKYLLKTPLSFDLSRAHSQVILADYVLDLRDEEVVKTFDTMFISAKSVKNLSQVYRQRKLDIDANLILDLSGLEDLYQKDLAANAVGRIVRNLRTHSRQESESMRTRLENIFFKLSSQRDIATAFMQLQQRSNEWEYYIFRSWGEQRKFSLLYTWQEKINNRTQAVFSTDKDFKNLFPINIVRDYQHKDSSLSVNGLRIIQRRLLKMLPEASWEKLDFSNWEGRKHKNFGLKAQIVVSPEFFNQVPSLTRNEVKAKFREFMKKRGLVARDYFLDSDDRSLPSADEVLTGALHKFSLGAQKVLDAKLSMNQRFDALTGLRQNHLFKDSGLAFFSDLAGSGENLIHVDVYLSTADREMISSHGNGDVSLLYKKLLSIKSSLDNETYDILLEAESLNNFRI